ncbi:MAG: response regulator transcription factor [Actinomycetia bacterium]|nr:response regulator transcription factor [Actinomycetes bacterium]
MGSRASGVLWVSGDPTYREALKLVLTHHGFTVVDVATGAEGLRALDAGGFDAVVLDLWIKDLPGFSACHRFRSAASGVPIVALADGSDEVYQLAAVYAGANESLPKPLHVSHFLERLAYWVRAPRPVAERDVEVIVDPDRRTVYFRGEPVDLTSREFQLLQTLAQSPGVVIPRETLLDRVWGIEALDLELRTVDATVARIRKKFWEKFQETPIETVPGFGYRLRDRRPALYRRTSR